MLNNPKWQQTKSDPLTLESLKAWLEKMPADEGYRFLDGTGKCPIAQYMTSLGLSWERDYDYCDTCHKIFGSQLAAMAVLAVHPQTFGAALARARAITSTTCGES